MAGTKYSYDTHVERLITIMSELELGEVRALMLDSTKR